jgi:diadenosine tetraphosphate (Ap4A) HIT family hydrolase
MILILMEICQLCNPPQSRVLARMGKAYAMYSLYPVSDYHALLVPIRHLKNESQLTSKENDDLLQLRRVLVRVVGDKSGLQSYNFGVNVGADAGQSEPHMAYHLIFRAKGDSGAPVGGVRAVIPSRADPSLHDDGNGIDKVSKWTEETKLEVQSLLHRDGMTVPT